MNNTPQVKAFLSCSIRPKDTLLVNAVEKFLSNRGFQCYTVGRNISYANQSDEAIRHLVNSCDCLIGLATERLDATDRDFPLKTLKIATPYLLQETSMAFQSGLPFLIFKTPLITLQGITNRNLWIEIEESLGTTRLIRFRRKKELVDSAILDLKNKALQRRQSMEWENLQNVAGKLSTVAIGGYAAYKGIDWLFQPPCFGEFYYKDPVCKDCSYKGKCKIRKAEINNL